MSVPLLDRARGTDRTSPPRRRPRIPRGHRLFTGVLAVAAALRALTMLGYRPARIYYDDSYSYMALALHPRPSDGFRNLGYPLLLWLLRPLHSVVAVVVVQHVMGLAIGTLVYALLRRRGLPAWGAALATVPVLFDGQMLQLEHAVLSDTLFILLVVAAVTALTWSSVPSARAAAAAGGLLAFATLTRTVGLPLLVLVLGLLAVRRARRPLAVAALTGLLPLALYAGWYRAEHGRFALSGADGVSLWARTMTFADCRVIDPPPSEAWLCPNGSRQDAASEYLRVPDSPINRRPGGLAENDEARSFALRAIRSQPLGYLGSVGHDVSLAFHWTPARHPKRVTPAFGFKKGAWPPPDVPDWARRSLREYAPGTTGAYRSAEPYAAFLRAYQHPAYLRGPLLAAVLLAGAAGLRRGALLPWAAAVTLLVAPVAVLDFDHRYVLPVVPLACVAAALAAAGRTRATGRSGPMRS